MPLDDLSAFDPHPEVHRVRIIRGSFTGMTATLDGFSEDGVRRWLKCADGERRLYAPDEFERLDVWAPISVHFREGPWA